MKTHWKKNFNYNYLGSYSLPHGKDVVLRIKHTKKELVVGEKGRKDECFVCYFDGYAYEKLNGKFTPTTVDWIKPMILNRTNCKTLQKILNTPFIEDWLGCYITVGISLVDMAGEKVEGLRIRDTQPKSELPTVDKDESPIIWDGICKAVSAGYTIKQIQQKYKLTAKQIEELNRLTNG